MRRLGAVFANVFSGGGSLLDSLVGSPTSEFGDALERAFPPRALPADECTTWGRVAAYVDAVIPRDAGGSPEASVASSRMRQDGDRLVPSYLSGSHPTLFGEADGLAPGFTIKLHVDAGPDQPHPAGFQDEIPCVILGHAGTGKSTLAEYLSKLAEPLLRARDRRPVVGIVVYSPSLDDDARTGVYWCSDLARPDRCESGIGAERADELPLNDFARRSDSPTAGERSRGLSPYPEGRPVAFHRGLEAGRSAKFDVGGGRYVRIECKWNADAEEAPAPLRWRAIRESSW